MVGVEDGNHLPLALALQVALVEVVVLLAQLILAAEAAALERQTKDLLVQLVLVQQTPAVLVVAQVRLAITAVQAVLELQTQ